MKKTFIALAACVAAAAQVYAFDVAVTLKTAGSVSEYTKIEYAITEKFGDYYRSPKAKFVHTFNANGQETETTELTSKDNIVDRVTYIYNDKGNVETAVCTDEDGKVQWRMVSTYDENGRKIDESEYNASETLVNRSIWRFSNKQIDESFYNADGALLEKIITKIDDKGRTTEVAQYRADGVLDEKRAYTYNDAGKLSEIVFSNPAGQQTKRIVYRFDASYDITEEQTYNQANKLVVRVIYKYDTNGNIAKTTTYNIAEKFGSTVNELAGICEYTYNYNR